ncbi:hypothetical protein BC833DRAFT_662605 [Globomyces pollinis-pini]|nr:hypothetical protein BC833DRAFT_662605 [Globomyces pollinis-pini]
MAAFEAVIIQNIKVSMATFYEWRTGKFNQELDQIKTIQTQLTAMDPEQDWKVFKDNHANRFLENVPLVQIKELRYEGWDHPGLQIVKQGKLLRKEGVFKRAYKTSLGILTRSGYLHSVPELQPDEQFYELPEQTIDLMDCTLVPLMMNEKEPEEIGMFRGVTMADSAEWWGAISQEMKRHEGERNLPVANVQKEDGNEINPQVNVKPGGNGKPTLPTNQTNTKVVGNEIPPPTNPIKTTNTKPPPPKRDPPSQQPIPVLPVEPEPQPIPISSFATFDPPPIASLSITEQMERRMATATTASPPPVMDIPQFDAPSHNPPPAKSNPWDTFEADNGGW